MCFQVGHYEAENLDFLRCVMWKLLTISLVAASQKRARWPASLTVSKMLELCMSVFMKVKCWIEKSKKTIRQVSAV